MTRALLLAALLAGCGESAVSNETISGRYGAELQACARLPAPDNDACACRVAKAFGRSCAFLDGGRDAAQ